MQNSKSKTSNTGYKGIYLRKSTGKFEIHVSVKTVKGDVEKIYLGAKEKLKDAITIREEYIKSLF